MPKPCDLRVPPRLSTMVYCLLLYACLMSPVRAPPITKSCPLSARLEGSSISAIPVACDNQIICDDDVETWNFANYSTEGFSVFGPVPARLPEKVGVNMTDYEENGNSMSRIALHWSLPPMSFDVHGFITVLRNYNNGSVTSSCRMFKIGQNTTDTYDNVVFVYEMPPLLQNSDYLLAVFSVPMPSTMPSEANKAWMVLKIRNSYSLDAQSNVDWRPNLLLQRLPFPGELKIQFSLKPVFTFYEIHALNTDTNEAKTFLHEVDVVNLTQTFYVITRLFKGTYQIMVRPFNDPNNCVCFEDSTAKNKTCADTCPETLSMKFMMSEDEPIPETTTVLFTGTIQQVTLLETTTTTVNPNDFLTPEATRNQDVNFVESTSTGDPLEMMPSTIQRTNNSLIGGLIGGLVAAGLFSFIVVVFAVLDKPPPPRKSKVTGMEYKNVPSTVIERTHSSMIGGVIGGLIAAGLFTLIIIIFTILEEPPAPPRKSKSIRPSANS